MLQDREDRVVLRVGETVRHPREHWTASVHALLGYLRDRGFAEAPDPVAVGDDTRRSPTSRASRATTPVGWSPPTRRVAAVAQLLRRYHDIVAEWRPSESSRSGTTARSAPAGGDQLVCHGDVGPWNLVWRDGRLVGLIDWEYATIGTRRTDIAYALHYLAPVPRPQLLAGHSRACERRPRRRHRMAVFAEAYGIAVDDQLVDEVLDSQQAGVQMMITLAERGRLRQRQLIDAGELDRERRAVVWTADRRDKFLRDPG